MEEFRHTHTDTHTNTHTEKKKKNREAEIEQKDLKRKQVSRTRENRKKKKERLYYHEVLACQAYGVDGALDIDGRLLLRAVGIREVHLGAGSLHDVLDVGAVAAHHGKMVLGGDVQLCAHGDGTRQAPG